MKITTVGALSFKYKRLLIIFLRTWLVYKSIGRGQALKAMVSMKIHPVQKVRAIHGKYIGVDLGAVDGFMTQQLSNVL